MDERAHRTNSSESEFKGQATKQDLIVVWVLVVLVFVICGAIAYLNGGIK